MRASKSVFLSLVILLFATIAVAQNRPAEYLDIIEFETRPGAGQGFEDYVKKIVEAAKKEGGEPKWATFQVTMGAPRYVVVLYFNKWGEMDGWQQLSERMAKAYGKDEAAKIMRAGSATIESMDERVYTLLPDHSTKLDNFSGLASNYFVVETEVKPDMTTEYERYLSKLKAASDKTAEYPYVIRRRSLIGPTATYLTSLPLEKLGDFDSWPGPGQVLAKMYGEEEGRRLQDLRRRCVKNQEIYVITYRPDLSWWSSTPTTD